MEELTRIRKELGWSQQKLADVSGVNKATINQIERARRSPNVETLMKLADAMDREMADFFPKVQAPLFPPHNETPELRRTLHLELLATYASGIADKMHKEIDAGHVTPEWGLTFYGEMTGMSMLFNEMLKLFPGPVPEQGLLISESEKQGLDKASQAIGKFDEVAKKLDEVVDTSTSEREREALKASFRIIQGEWSA